MDDIQFCLDTIVRLDVVRCLEILMPVRFLFATLVTEEPTILSHASLQTSYV